ncbi:MAG: radical SAM protein, partial [Verrucomicrobia bacterium]|nr:radical SAM protein [Verrucomicrobiota bacterium]
LLRAFHLLAERVERVELLIGYEGNEFFPAGEAESEFLSVLAVHPMREDAAAAFLQRAGADPAVLDRLKREGLVREAVHGGRRFYLRRFKRGAAAE